MRYLIEYYSISLIYSVLVISYIYINMSCMYIYIYICICILHTCMDSPRKKNQWVDRHGKNNVAMFDY